MVKRRLLGHFSPPGDKSITHRAFILAGLARGESRLRGLNPGRDCLSTRQVMARLGAQFSVDGDQVGVRGMAGLPKEPGAVLDCGNSGTTLRLLMGVAAARPGVRLFTGDASLCGRPMARVAKPLREMGASIWLRRDEFAPLAVKGGRLRPVTCEMAVASAQVKSAVLLAGLLTEGRTEVEEPVATRDHTERLMEHFGVRVHRNGTRIAVEGGAPWEGRDVEIPGDLSAAAFFLTAAALVEGSEVTARNVGINPTRWGAMSILDRMGAVVKTEGRSTRGPEETADVTVRGSRLNGTAIRGGETAGVIDELPVLAVAACCAEGTTEIGDAGELRVKESDRLSGLAAGLKALGARVHEEPDGLIIEGGGPDFRFRSARVDSLGDHRLAMAFSIAGLRSDGPVEIEGVDCMSVSDPGFFATLRALGGA